MKLHLAVNSGFIEQFAEITYSIDTKNEHFFIVYGEQMTGQIINNKRALNYYKNLLEAKEIIKKKIEKCTTLYIHFLSNEVIDFLSDFDLKKIKIVWFLWGADAFSLPEVYKKLKMQREDFLKAYLGKLKQVLFPLRSSLDKLNFLKKIDFVAHYLIDDFKLIKHLLKPSAEFRYFTYGILENIVCKENTVSDNYILLGNSASINNQHIYTINKILPKNLTNKIIAPLAYGSNKDYINKVISEGKRKFGDNFIPITELIETESYQKNVLGRAEFAIMPHNRSQALGNILQLLWQGCKIFMYPSNNLFKFLKQKGFQVFELNKTITKNLYSVQVNVEHNRKLLTDFFSINTLKKHYLEILSI